MLVFNNERLLDPYQTSNRNDHPLSVIQVWTFNLSNIWVSSVQSANL